MPTDVIAYLRIKKKQKDTFRTRAATCKREAKKKTHQEKLLGVSRVGENVIPDGSAERITVDEHQRRLSGIADSIRIDAAPVR